MNHFIISISIFLFSSMVIPLKGAVQINNSFSQKRLPIQKENHKRTSFKSHKANAEFISKPTSTTAMLVGVIGIVLILLSQLEFGLLILAGLVGIGALIVGIRGIRKEGRGIGAFGMFFGGISIIIGLFALIGRLLF